MLRRQLLPWLHSMRQVWHPDKLAQDWTLSTEEHELLSHKPSTTRLPFAVLLKAFQREGRFPERREEVADHIVAHLARQIGVLSETYRDGNGSERTQRHQRAEIREYYGFRLFHAEEEPAFVACLSERVTSPHPEAEDLKTAAYEHLRAQRLEPPATERLRRLLRLAVARREERLMAETVAQLSPAIRHALDALVTPQTPETPEETDQIALFPVRSDLATVKNDAGAVSVETVLGEIAKLKQLRALGRPEELFRGAPARLVTHYRQRAANEPPRELRRHPPDVRHTLLAALCWQREQEITDNLVELLIHIAHRVGVRAEEKVESELLKHAKKVIGKARLLYKLAKAAKEQPDGMVRDVICPAVGERTLEELIQEGGNHRKAGTASQAGHARLLQPSLPPHHPSVAGDAVVPL